MHAIATNRVKHKSTRLVDQQSFELWHFLMRERHGFSVSDLLPCVWLPNAEYERQGQRFVRLKWHMPATRITFDLIDKDSGVVTTKTRYVPDQDLPLLKTHLNTHFSTDDITTTTTTPGVALSNFAPTDCSSATSHAA